MSCKEQLKKKDADALSSHCIVESYDHKFDTIIPCLGVTEVHIQRQHEMLSVPSDEQNNSTERKKTHQPIVLSSNNDYSLLSY
jgi:hypothetical protein